MLALVVAAAPHRFDASGTLGVLCIFSCSLDLERAAGAHAGLRARVFGGGCRRRQVARSGATASCGSGAGGVGPAPPCASARASARGRTIGDEYQRTIGAFFAIYWRARAWRHRLPHVVCRTGARASSRAFPQPPVGRACVHLLSGL